MTLMEQVPILALYSRHSVREHFILHRWVAGFHDHRVMILPTGRSARIVLLGRLSYGLSRLGFHAIRGGSVLRGDQCSRVFCTYAVQQRRLRSRLPRFLNSRRAPWSLAMRLITSAEAASFSADFLATVEAFDESG